MTHLTQPFEDYALVNRQTEDTTREHKLQVLLLSDKTIVKAERARFWKAYDAKVRFFSKISETLGNLWIFPSFVEKAFQKAFQIQNFSGFKLKFSFVQLQRTYKLYIFVRRLLKRNLLAMRRIFFAL